EPRVELVVQLSRPDGSPLTSLTADQDFVLHVLARDASAVPHGGFAAYMDVLWDASKAVATGSIQYGSLYPNGKSGVVSPGRIDEVASFAGSTAEIGDGLNEVYRVPMRASGAGPLTFALDP